MSTLIFILIFISSAYTSATNIAKVGSDVVISWNKNTEVDLAGYNIYVGFNSRNYNSDLTRTTTDTFFIYKGFLDVIDSSTSVFWSVTAFDTANNESGFSPEVIYPDARPPVEPIVSANQEIIETQPSDWYDSRHPVELLIDNNDIYLGPWNSKHVYTVKYIGKGKEIEFKIQDKEGAYHDNFGLLSYNIQAKNWSMASVIHSNGTISIGPFVSQGEEVFITISGTFNYWNSFDWAISDGEYHKDTR